MLTPFFRNNYNLTNININYCDFGEEGGRLFALAIGSSTHKSLKDINLRNNDISEEGMVHIITALSMYPQLQTLNLEGNHLRKTACVALATLLQCSAKEVQSLFISCNEIGDDGIEALVPALTNCSCLKYLSITNNPSITTSRSTNKKVDKKSIFIYPVWAYFTCGFLALSTKVGTYT